MPVTSKDIEISHQLNVRNKPIIAKFQSHKVKTNLYKKRVALKKNIRVSDIFPTNSSYATAIGRDNRLYLNEKLTAYRRSIVKRLKAMTKDGLLLSVWTLDSKV